MFWKPNDKTVLIVTVGLLFGSAIGIAVWLVLSALSAASMRSYTRGELLAELNQIDPPAGAVAIRNSEIVKGSLVLVGKHYTFNGTYEDIRKYYDSELGSRGWRFVEERNLKNWGQDYGERDAYYCKQGMSAALFYNGSLASQRGYLYQVNLSWGLDDCSEKKRK
jgi:hypothetical protein